MFRLQSTHFKRRLTASTRCGDRSKIQLKQLGNILSKGGVGKEGGSRKVGSSSNTKTPKKTLSHSLEESEQRFAQELKESSMNLGLMSKHDIKVQTTFDEGRQFGSHPYGQVQRRSSTINNLPDEIDLLETPWEEVEKIYQALKDLDSDQVVHHKCKERIHADTKNLLSIRPKRLTDYCKFERREQISHLSALEQALESAYYFNVVGFDRSFLGAPLSKDNSLSPEKGKSLNIPVELFADARTNTTKVPIYKREVNFLENDAFAELWMPSDGKPSSPEDFLVLEGKPIMVKSIDDYNTLDHESAELKTQVESEILSMQRQLTSEITRSTIPLPSVSKRRLKTNQYILVAKIPYATKDTGPTFKYALNHFDLIPYYGSLFTTAKHRRHLYKHLLKVMLLNVSDQMDSLTRIKYKSPEDREDFMKRTFNQIHEIVETKLMQWVWNKRLAVPRQYNVFLHKKLNPGSFSRIYWLTRNPYKVPQRRSPLRRSPMVLRIFNNAPLG